MEKDFVEITLPNGEKIKVKKPTASDLPYQLRVRYEGGEVKTIPGSFRRPEDLHYSLDHFVSIDVYDALEDIIRRLKLSVKDQLQIIIALMNNLDRKDSYPEPVVRAEIFDTRTDETVVAADDRESTISDEN